MRKWSLLSLVVVGLVLVGCQKDEGVEVRVLVPHGSTAMAMAHLNYEQEDYEFESYVQGSDPLVAAFTSESANVIVAPTNLGATLYQKDVPYSLAATIVWGNLFLVSTEPLTSEALKGETIAAFGQGSTPDIVLQTILKEKGLLDEVEIVYYNAVADVSALVASGEAKIALIAEPSLTVLKTKVENVNTIIDCQETWGELFGVTSYPQASVFIHQDLIEKAPNTVKQLLTNIENSVKYANDSTEAMATEAIETGLDMPEAVIVKSTKNSNLLYKSASDAKSEIELYLQKLYEFEPKTVGGQLPDDDFYYLGK